MQIHASAQNLHGIPVAFLKKAFSVTNSGINAKIPVALLKTTIFVTISGMPFSAFNAWDAHGTTTGRGTPVNNTGLS